MKLNYVAYLFVKLPKVQ